MISTISTTGWNEPIFWLWLTTRMKMLEDVIYIYIYRQIVHNILVLTFSLLLQIFRCNKTLYLKICNSSENVSLLELCHILLHGHIYSLLVQNKWASITILVENIFTLLHCRVNSYCQITRIYCSLVTVYLDINDTGVGVG